MDTALTQKFPFILDRNLAKDNCTENHVCTSCDTVALVFYYILQLNKTDGINEQTGVIEYQIIGHCK